MNDFVSRFRMNLLSALICTSLLTLTLQSQQKNPVEPAFQSLSNYSNVRDLTISTHHNEAYLTVQSPLNDLSVIVRLNKVDTSWSKPQLASFSGRFKDLEPFISTDGLRLYFASNRPLNEDSNTPKDFDIWYVMRDNLDDAWSDPIRLNGPVNSTSDEFYPSLAANNNLYFTSDREGTKGKDDVFFSKWESGTYAEPLSLGAGVNSESYEFNAFIAPDETFIIFSGYNRKDGSGSGDLYISYKDENDHWIPAINLGKDINSPYMDYCPFMDPDTNTLYFTSRRSTIKEVNDFDSLDSALKEINQYENGFSRIYKVTIDDINRFKNN